MSLYGYVEEQEAPSRPDRQLEWQLSVERVLQSFHVHVRNPYERGIAKMTPETRFALVSMRDDITRMLASARTG